MNSLSATRRSPIGASVALSVAMSFAIQATDPIRSVPLAVEKQPIDIGFDAVGLPGSTDVAFTAKDLPSTIRKLIGRRVRLAGFACSYGQATMRSFVLRRKEEINPNETLLLRHDLVVEMRSGSTFTITSSPIVVEGRLDIRHVDDGDGRKVSVFCLKNATVTQRRK